MPPDSNVETVSFPVSFMASQLRTQEQYNIGDQYLFARKALSWKTLMYWGVRPITYSSNTFLGFGPDPPILSWVLALIP